VFALAAIAHVALVVAMWRSSLTHDEPAASRVVEATIWLPPAPMPRAAAVSLAAPRATRLRAVPHVHPDPLAIRAPVLESTPVAQVATPPASAASQPLDLRLTRDQLRAVIAGSKPSLAQSLAAAPKPSALARLGGDDAPYEEVQMAGGVTEVHVHGGCARLVPTPRAQYDPFNHANERLTASCK
jgi:hypothetical protein